MNQVFSEKRAQVIAALVEGNSIRSVVRQKSKLTHYQSAEGAEI